MTRNSYWAYGLTIDSEIALPELPSGQGKPDVIVSHGQVPPDLPQGADVGPLYQALPSQLLLKLDQVAHYLVREGSEIVIARYLLASDEDVRLFLLESCLAAISQQRGRLVLHASSLYTPQGAVIIAGPSSTGKSTLLAALVTRGYKMLADEVTCLVLDEQQHPIVLPAYPQINLWGHTATKLGFALDEKRRLRPKLLKYGISMSKHFFSEPVPLRAIYILGRHQRIETEMAPILGSARFEAIKQNLYQSRWLNGLHQLRPSLMLAARVANAVHVIQVVRPEISLSQLNQFVDRIEVTFS